MSTPTEGDPATRLGHEVVRRLRRPGTVSGRLLPARIGSIASGSTRFATSLARPGGTRQRLAGPGAARVHSYLNAGVRPPRWWGAETVDAVAEHRQPHLAFAERVEPEELPSRGLPRAVRRVPDADTWTPGGIVESLVSIAAPVRRLDEVRAAGSMLTSHDRAKLTAAANAAAAPRRQAAAAARAPKKQRSYSGREAPALPPGLAKFPGSRTAPATGPTGGPPAGQPPSAAAPRARAATQVHSPWSPAGPARLAGGGSAAVGGGSAAAAVAAPIRRSTATAWLPMRASRLQAGRDASMRAIAEPRHRASRAGSTPAPVPAPAAVAATRPAATATADRPAGAPEHPHAAHGHAPSAPAAAHGHITSAPVAPPEVPSITSLGSASASSDAPAGEPRTIAATSSLPTATRPIAAAPTAPGLSSAVPSRLARPAALRRMIGRSHALRPAARTSDSAVRPLTAPATGTRPDAAEELDPIRRTQSGRHAAAASSPAAPVSGTGAAKDATSPSTPGAAAGPGATSRPADTQTAAATAVPATPAVATAVPAASAAATAVPATAAPAAAISRSGSPGRHARRTDDGPSGLGLAAARTLRPAAKPSAIRPALSVPMLPVLDPTSGSLAAAAVAASTPHTDMGAPLVARRAAPGIAVAAAARATGPATHPAGHPGQAAHPGQASHPAQATRPAVAVAMPFATGRTPGALRRRRSGALVSGFATTEEIRPATARLDPRALAMSPPASAPVAGSPAHPSVPRSASGARPGTLAPNGRLLPAPPPVTVRRTPERSSSSGRSPAAASASGLPLVPGPDGTLRRSLVETTADLFRKLSPTAKPTQTATPGDEMPEQQRRLSVVRGNQPAARAGQAPEPSILDDPRRLDELVDKVVDKIEQRVVDELERRGRRHTPGVF